MLLSILDLSTKKDMFESYMILDMMHVSAACRGKGIGRSLFDVRNEASWKLMERLGFERMQKAHKIGDIVKVTVDRPMGSYHPKHKDICYPVNYGYIEGIMAPDGEEQDAYLLGVDRPVDEFTGKIIAMIHRYDDVEEKWVVAPEGQTFTVDEIKAQVAFQEQYFNSEIRI